MLDAVVEINSIPSMIQLSVAPVFLLAGVAGLLNVFTGRLVRIIDKVDKLDKFEYDKEAEGKIDNDLKQLIKDRRKFLTMRMDNTNRAIFFGTTTGLFIALVIITIFFSSFFHFKYTILIAILFILGMSTLVISLILFLRELFYTTKFINNKRSYIP
ncbi:hypothetical protein AAX26_01103 [Aliarcobacter thereius]|uniref:DUF2721 domain-containing protein n=2 Tax=Aliarcobacter thereius TaxID=544718 RepID=A0A1C0B7E6_9BACT|nr:DUF2721 domain-containing protein [Aliarcobacter thereius]OCL86797.1 hypothetical protein AAX26_01103 [Aliarcobacter thereius]OCL90999.1 hypothetical protein AAX25_01167 [Aliarcobacter thereius]OCL96171.1 hypothetical protein AA347_01662 [Aliarcobacter thereius LMG 24486]OCL99504.1 hypothetical protein AAX29_01318 [Aliarcobacter thereius]QBF15862.1 hypothetical membrane protein (DUF2721 domain) [Aliarcobacter thereius LMG 24486]